MEQANYLVPHDVYLCRTPDGTVFLDTARERYFAINEEATSALASALQGFPGPTPQVVSASVEVDLLDLERQGLLTRERSAGRSYSPTSLPTPDMQRSILIVDRTPKMEIRHLGKFVYAFARAWWMLRFLPFRQITMKLEGTRRTLSQHAMERDLPLAEDLLLDFQ